MSDPTGIIPCIASTWSFSVRGNAAAWPALSGGGDPLDAVLEACRVAEEDPAVDSVGFGGLPDAAGRVSLDGCVMRSPAECGSACGLRKQQFANAGAMGRGAVERNFLHSDGSVALRRTSYRDPTLVAVNSYPNDPGNAKSVFHYLPPE